MAYGLTATDLGFGGGKTKMTASTRQTKSSPKAPTTAGVAKYRDPKTQKTWTGRGKPPAWIAGVKDRDTYLIGEMSANATPIEPVQKSVKKSVKRPRAGAVNER